MKKRMYRMANAIFDLNLINTVEADDYLSYLRANEPSSAAYRILLKLQNDTMISIRFPTAQERDAALNKLHPLLCPEQPSQAALRAFQWIAYAAVAIGLCAYGQLI
jgi:hypothetical protein